VPLEPKRTLNSKFSGRNVVRERWRRVTGARPKSKRARPPHDATESTGACGSKGGEPRMPALPRSGSARRAAAALATCGGDCYPGPR
jgi:hypothetical protein